MKEHVYQGRDQSMMTYYALCLLRLLRRWSVGSIHKFAEELEVEPLSLIEAVSELQEMGFLITYPMKDNSPFANEMLEITQKGLDFIEAYDGPID